MSVAVAAMAFAGCSTDNTTDDIAAGKTRTITINCPDTRTQIGFDVQGSYLAWSEGDKVAYATDKDVAKEATVVNKQITITVTDGAGDLFLMYPAGSNVGKTWEAMAAVIPVQATQSEASVFNGENLPMTAMLEIPVGDVVDNPKYSVAGRVVCFEISSTAYSAEKVKSVRMTAADGVQLATSVDVAGSVVSGSASNVVETILTTPAAIASGNYVYLTVYPGNFTGVSIEVTTDAAVYSMPAVNLNLDQAGVTLYKVALPLDKGVRTPVATLTNADITAIDLSSYATFSYTNDFGVWSGYAYKSSKTSAYLQFRKDDESTYIKVPNFVDKYISNATFGVCAATDPVAPFTGTLLVKDAPNGNIVAQGQGTSTISLTIDQKYATLYVVAGDSGMRITDITLVTPDLQSGETTVQNTLATPSPTETNYIVTWPDVLGAIGYEYTLDNGTTATPVEGGKVDCATWEDGTYSVKIRAIGDGVNFVNSDWSVACEVTVSSASIKYFKQITDVSAIDAAGTYILASKVGTKYYYAGAYKSNKLQTTEVAFDADSNGIPQNSINATYLFKIEPVDGTTSYSFWCGAEESYGTPYMGYNSSTNFKFSATKPTSANTDMLWNITVDATSAKINSVKTVARFIRLNTNSGTPQYFGPYTATQAGSYDVMIFKLEE